MLARMSVPFFSPCKNFGRDHVTARGERRIRVYGSFWLGGERTNGKLQNNSVGWGELNQV